MVSDVRIEDTVLLLDVSRSMIRKDFEPDRIGVAIENAKNFIQNKFLIDPKDRVSILSFGQSIKKLCPFTNEEEKLYRSLNKIYISGNGNLHEGIAFSMQILVEEMRKLGGKISRIYIISDNKTDSNLDKLQEMANIAKGLGIFIDICQIGKLQHSNPVNLRRIAQVTKGEFGYFNNPKALITAGKSFASKKPVKDSSDMYSPEKKPEIPPLISEVALPLRRPTVLEIQKMMSGKYEGQDKCNICHSKKAPLTGADFYSEGRSCPSCDRAMHISCAAQWAKKTEYKPHVFRCPFCYFLVEIPKSALKLVDEETVSSQKIKILDDIKSTNMILVPEEEIEQIDASCSYCNNIFLGDTKVFRCEKCASYYHGQCLEKMSEELNACRFCGADILSKQ